MSYGNSSNKRYELPPDYQEVLALHEIELSKSLNTDILRKMVYLYTIGMEYYNITKKPQLEKFYNDKLIGLLTRPDVLDYLDKNPINFNEYSDLNMFKPQNQNAYGVFIDRCAKDNNSRENLMNEYTTNVNGGVIKFSKAKYNFPSKEEMLKIIRDRISAVDLKLSRVDDRISKQIVVQMSNFEDKKRQMKTRKRTNSLRKSTGSVKSEDSSKGEQKESIASINSDLIKKLAELSGVSLESDLVPSAKVLEEMSNELPARKRRVSVGQNLMLKEIEEYVEKNMNEMYKALDELRESFDSEIKEAEENGYPEIADGLREDMEVELENLKDQYEEQRRVETDKIRAKYQKRGSFARL